MGSFSGFGSSDTWSGHRYLLRRPIVILRSRHNALVEFLTWSARRSSIRASLRGLHIGQLVAQAVPHQVPLVRLNLLLVVVREGYAARRRQPRSARPAASRGSVAGADIAKDEAALGPSRCESPPAPSAKSPACLSPKPLVGASCSTRCNRCAAAEYIRPDSCLSCFSRPVSERRRTRPRRKFDIGAGFGPIES